MMTLWNAKNRFLRPVFSQGWGPVLMTMSLALAGCAHEVIPQLPPQAATPAAKVEVAKTSSQGVTEPVRIAMPEVTSGLPSFDVWVEEFRREALAAGIRAATLDAAFDGVKPIERVIELDRKQPESVLTFEEYLARVVPARRITIGREKLAQNRALLDEVSAKFKVPARFIVALWGIETDYGRLGGNFSVIASLATLAYEGRRAALFRNQLLDALRILDAGDVALSDLRGSWAGAMGQTQFMPSTFRNYAVDFNGDGKRDPWNQLADVFGSAANYLSKIGWVNDETWGSEVRVPDNFNREFIGLQQSKPLAEWRALGVQGMEGAELANSKLTASLVQPSGPDGRAFLVYDNFRVLMQWNRSTYFGVAVGQLADALD